MRISDWSSDVCSSDLFRNAVAAEAERPVDPGKTPRIAQPRRREGRARLPVAGNPHRQQHRIITQSRQPERRIAVARPIFGRELAVEPIRNAGEPCAAQHPRSEENTSELQSLMRNSYAVFCLKKKTKKK